MFNGAAGEKCCRFHPTQLITRSMPCLKCANSVSTERLRRHLGRAGGFEKEKSTQVFDVPDFVKAYPSPAPPFWKRKDIYHAEDYKHIDERIREVPEECLFTCLTLVTHLLKGLSGDVEKVRAIYSWLRHYHISGDPFTDVMDLDSPKAYLYEAKKSTATYTKIFTILCRQAQVPCVIIHGRKKSIEYSTGDRKGVLTSWNAVYVAEGWRFVHFNWTASSHVDPNQIDIICADGATCHQTSASQRGRNIDDCYFLVDPEVFAFICHPQETRWQLLQCPLSYKRFVALPFIHPLFVEAGLSFKPGQTGIINSQNGECEVALQAARWDGQLRSTLFNKTSQEEMLEGYVAMLNKNQSGEIRIRIRFPKEGDYILSLFILRENHFQWICDFKLACDSRKPHCRRLPEVPSRGWGPRVSDDAIFDVSHDDGIIQSVDDTVIEVHFKTKGTSCTVNTRLKHDTLPHNTTKQYVSTSVISNNVTIKLRAPDGEYALLIDLRKKDGSWSNVLNYIIKCGRDKTKPEGHRENATEKHVRHQLREATQDRRKEDLIVFIDKFESFCLEDNGHLTKARRTLETLLIKEDLRYAVMRGRTDQLEKAISRACTSDVTEEVQRDVARAEVVFQQLLKRQATPRTISAINMRNLSELRTIRAVSVSIKEVLTAVFLVLGENRLHVEDNTHLLGLLSKTGSEGLLARLRKFNPKAVDKSILKRVNHLLEKQKEEQLYRICPSILKIHNEGKRLVQACLERDTGKVSEGLDPGSTHDVDESYKKRTSSGCHTQPADGTSIAMEGTAEADKETNNAEERDGKSVTPISGN